MSAAHASLRDTTHFMVFDCESIGIHGEAFAVAYTLIKRADADKHAGRMVEERGWWCERRLAEGVYDPHVEVKRALDSDVRWLEEHRVEEQLREWDGGGHMEQVDSPYTVRQAFWEAWCSVQERYPQTLLAAECPWPVEANFLTACVRNRYPERQWTGPHPLIDIDSVLLAAGWNPRGVYRRLEGEFPEVPAHHPLADARQSARLLLWALRDIAKGTFSEEKA